MKPTTIDTKYRQHQQQRRQRRQELPAFGKTKNNMEARTGTAAALVVATEHTKSSSLFLPPTKQQWSPAPVPLRFVDALMVESDDSSTELDVHSLDRLREEAKRRFSGAEGCYGYETMEMGCRYDDDDEGGVDESCRLANSDSAIAYHHDYQHPGSNRYGEEKETPRTKRRRLMKRRNSQTPAMLLASSATVFLANGGFGDILDRGIDVDEALNMSLMSLASTEVSSTSDVLDDSTNCVRTGLGDSQCWSKGVDVAEKLVKRLQQRG